MEEYKKFLETTLKQLKETLDEKRKKFEASNEFNEEKKRNHELRLELMNLQQEPAEYKEILEKSMLELKKFLTFYSEKIKKFENDDCFNDIEEQFEQCSLALSEFAKKNYKDIMTFEELVKQKEEYIKEVSEITTKIDSLDYTFEQYKKNIKQQINEYEEITKNINKAIKKSGDLNQLSLLVDKKKAELNDLEEKYNNLEAQKLQLETKFTADVVFSEN